MIEASVFLHASSVVTNSGAILFLGHSTSGKSTIARILSSKFQILADDTVFVIKNSNGSWCVQNGKMRCNSDSFIGRSVDTRLQSEDYYNLAGCYRIFKGDKISKHSIKAILLARYLMDAVMEVDIQRQPKFTMLNNPTISVVKNIRQKRIEWFRTVSSMARVFPGWELHFSKDSTCQEIANVIDMA